MKDDNVVAIFVLIVGFILVFIVAISQFYKL